jgi:hypothetical protein
MITSSLGTFLWIMSAYLYFFKYKTQMSSYYDVAFIAVVILFLYFINVEIMKERCGVFSSVVTPTIVPWLLIFLPFMAALSFFPAWKTPFSNTFGYLVLSLTEGVDSIKKIVKNQSQLELIYQSPSLLINQFTYDTFDDVAKEKYKDVFVKREDGAVAVAALDEFKNILLLKEIVATWIWYMLIGSITVSTSYMMMMNSDCTKTVDDYLMDRARSTQ